MPSPAISVRNLSKRYRLGATLAHDTLRDHVTEAAKGIGRVLTGRTSAARTERESLWALNNVSFDVEQGEVIGIIGRNGAGKSTLLKILSQITEPSAGEIRVRGRMASLLEVGTGFHPELSGAENIYLNGAILGMSKAEIRKKFDEITAFAEVEKFLDTPVKRYSSGMYVRLAFAVAAHLEPEILVVDEVLAVGDSAFQQRCLGKMDEVAHTGRTVLFVSHNMAAMGALCKTGLYLEKGRLKGTGPIHDVIRNYISDTAYHAQNRFCVETRKGTGLVRITDLQVTSDKMASTAVCGSKTRILLAYEAEKPDLPIQFRLGVFDLFNSRVLALDSGVGDDLPRTLPQKGRIALEFPDDFSLYPGRYTVNCAAVVRQETVDFIKSALLFNVEEGDFFGTGRTPYGKSSVLVKNKWTLLPC